MMKPNCCAINVAPDITLYHSGPPLDYGPLPSFFYFALSGTDSLMLEPYNQPVEFLHGQMIRVFSMTLPGHESNLPASKAIEVWADDLSQKKDPINDFLDAFEKALDFAIQQKFVDPKKIAVGGLSRGGFIALHAAAREERLKYVVAFAPITDLTQVHEFSSIQEKVRFLDLSQISQKLIQQNIRLYISNHDTRVSTQSCFDFAMSVVKSATSHQIRSPKVEFILYPPIGHQGHGTPPEIFKAGADWIISCLK
ncbi:MAG TPA: prolyl oligopeptidase family serine peptidase [Chlamydiales bacterium]|nr:prolyl oligopeptidase family serine peptidase [Chlamydiales bacterium]